MKPLAENRKAYYDYRLLDKYEAGLVLTGQEVKSIRNGRANITGAYILVRPKHALLLGAEIQPYQPSNMPADYDSKRSRKLLLNKKELNYLFGKAQEKGLTIIPLAIYDKNRKLKIEIAVAAPKKTHDKRETIKKRQTKREIERTLKT